MPNMTSKQEIRGSNRRIGRAYADRILRSLPDGAIVGGRPMDSSTLQLTAERNDDIDNFRFARGVNQRSS